MYCSNCGTELGEDTKFCGNCGQKSAPSKRKLPIILSIISVIAILGVFLVNYTSEQAPLTFSKEHVAVSRELPAKETVTLTKQVDSNATVQEVSTENPKDVSELINLALPKVFTIQTTYGQGSGFLIDGAGHVLTNAHVVEGDLFPTVRTSEGTEHSGTVIGYSNTTDIAVIQVPALEGKESLQLDTSTNTNIGDQVVALGSPQGYENTATLGNISGVGRSFAIPPFTFEDVYQTSAPIAPGSSGGPLLNQDTGKVIAVNSARDRLETNIAFSLPIYQVIDSINDWIASPMSEEAIADLFYYTDGSLFFNDYLDEEGYFEDDGYYDENYYEYYDYDEYDEYLYEDYWDSDWYDYDVEEVG